MQTLFEGIDLGEVSVSMTINAPAAIMLAFYVVAAEQDSAHPTSPERLSRHDPGRHPEGVHRPEGVVLPDRPRDAPLRRHDRVVHAPDAALAPDLDLRLPHPRGRLDRAAGAGVHAEGRAHLRRAGGRTRPRRRRLRAAPVLLLQRPDRLLRGDRQVPRRAPDLGQGAQGDLRRQEPEVVADALPHPDRRRQPHRPAAAEQRRAHRDRGAGRGARRHPVAAHELLRRGARAAHRGGRHESRCAPSR